MASCLPMASAFFVAAALAVAPVQAAQAPGAAGHWTGAIETPGQPLQVEVDLTTGTPPAWVGAISIPAQNLKGFPLASVEVKDTAVTFVIPKRPGRRPSRARCRATARPSPATSRRAERRCRSS